MQPVDILLIFSACGLTRNFPSVGGAAENSTCLGGEDELDDEEINTLVSNECLKEERRKKLKN